MPSPLSNLWVLLVQNDGEIYSFAGNAQQNGLTPFSLDTVPAQVFKDPYFLDFLGLRQGHDEADEQRIVHRPVTFPKAL